MQPKEIRLEQWENPSDVSGQFVPKLDIQQGGENPYMLFYYSI